VIRKGPFFTKRTQRTQSRSIAFGNRFIRELCGELVSS
jgi:hypothetical protein